MDDEGDQVRHRLPTPHSGALSGRRATVPYVRTGRAWMLALAVALAGVGWLAAPAIAAPVFSATLFEESGGVDPVC